MRLAELCATIGQSGVLGRATLAATGKHASQFKGRVLRLLGQDDHPAIRISTLTVAISTLVVLSLLLVPVAWRSAARATEEPNQATAAEPKESPEQSAPLQAVPSAKAEDLKPVSMSAAAFARLSPAEQRASLVRVFQRRLEHSRDLYYETEQIWRSYENYNNQDREASRGYEEAGRMLGQLPSNRVKCRHWRLGDSFRMDEEGYDKPSNVQWSSRSSEGVNAEEGIGRIADVSKDPKSPPSAQVVYPFDPLDNNRYILWLDGKHSLDLLYGQPRRDDYLFHHLVDHQAQFEITPLPDRDKVRLAFDWKPSWATSAGGKRVYLLDPQKGFLPVECDSRYDDPSTMPPRKLWRIEKFFVEESRLVGDVWMPTKLTETLAASTVPDRISVWAIKVLRIERGTVKPADLMVRFTEGMNIVDVIEGVTYVADAQGNPAGPVKFAPGWKHKPPETWPRLPSATKSKPDRSRAQADHSPAGKSPGTFSMASRLSAADRAMLQAEEDKKQARWKPIERGPEGASIQATRRARGTHGSRFEHPADLPDRRERIRVGLGDP